ncbi:hypothetical protein PoB_007679400 [Plakobranchus ocellatus]|uniref:DOMON domain-containing protein n=1 Tax=Plakobranchus ocellatus TaxID=259542 RepID=A0AAV4E1E0_9GAST|nr:hypothetical protein PoB_007679400 [Plakobranchus ocellatus]
MYGPLAAYDTYDKPLQSRKRRESTENVYAWEIRQNQGDSHSLAPPVMDESVIWILNRSPAMISGYSAKNGSFLGQINVASVSKVEGWATSKLSVARTSHDSTKDVLVLGMQASGGEAFLVAIEVEREKPSNAILIFSTKVGSPETTHHIPQQKNNFYYSNITFVKASDENDRFDLNTRKAGGSSVYSVVGQIVNVAVQKRKSKGVFVRQKEILSSDWNLGIVALVQESGPGFNKLHTAAVF